MLPLLGLILIRKQLLFSMCLLNCNWQISSLKHKLESNIGYTWSNWVVQILHSHLEFEGGVLKVLQYIKGPYTLKAHMAHVGSI